MKKVFSLMSLLILSGIFLFNAQSAEARFWNRNAYNNSTNTVIYNVSDTDPTGVNCEGLYGRVSSTWWPGGNIRVWCAGRLSCPGQSKMVDPVETTGTVTSDNTYSGTREFAFGNCNCYEADPANPTGIACLKVDKGLDSSGNPIPLPDGCISTLPTAPICGTNGQDTAASFTINCGEPPKPTVSCEAKDASGNTVTSISSRQPVTWTATADGGTKPYGTYTWSGDADSSYIGPTSSTSYTVTSSTDKTARVTVTDAKGQTSTQAACSVTVNPCTCTYTDSAGNNIAPSNYCPGNTFANSCGTAGACTGSKSCGSDCCAASSNSCILCSSPTCSISNITVGTTSCDSLKPDARNVTFTLSKSNITDSSITGASWTMNGTGIDNSCSGWTGTTGCQTKTSCVNASISSQTISASLVHPGGPTSCGTGTFNVGSSQTVINVPIAGAGTFGWERNISVNCGPPYDDNLANLTLDWTSSNNASYYEIWRRINNNAWKCMRGDRSDGNPRNCNGDAIPASQTSYLDDNMALYDDAGAQQYVYIVASVAPGGNTCISNLTGATYGKVDCSTSGDWVRLEKVCQPDLQVTSISYTPSSPKTGDTYITFTATVKNDGFGAKVPSWFRNNICIDLDSNNVCDYNNGYALLGGSWLNGSYNTRTESDYLHQGESRTVSWTMPSSSYNFWAIPTVGTHKVTICTDTSSSVPKESDRITETNEGNNCRNASYTVANCNPNLIGSNEFKGCVWNEGSNVNFNTDLPLAIAPIGGENSNPRSPTSSTVLPLTEPVPDIATPLFADLLYDATYYAITDNSISAKWRGRFTFNTGYYTFNFSNPIYQWWNPSVSIWTKWGVRVKFDGNTVLDYWSNNPRNLSNTNSNSTYPLIFGHIFPVRTTVLVDIEFFEETSGGDIYAQSFAGSAFWWIYRPSPTVDLKVKASDGSCPTASGAASSCPWDAPSINPLVVNANSTAQLSWTSTNAASCTASVTGGPTGFSDTNWRGGKILNSGTSNPTTSALSGFGDPYIYTLSCTNGYQTTSDSIYIKVRGNPWVQTSGDVHSNQ